MNVSFCYQRALVPVVSWSFGTEQETPAGSAPVRSCAAAFEENHAWSPLQTECYGGEWGLGSAEWILDSLGSSGCLLGLEYHLSSVVLQQGDGLYSQPVVSWCIQLQLDSGFESLQGLFPMVVGYGFCCRVELAQDLVLCMLNLLLRCSINVSSCARLVQQYSKVLIASCFAVSKLEDTIRFT